MPDGTSGWEEEFARQDDLALVTRPGRIEIYVSVDDGADLKSEKASRGNETLSLLENWSNPDPKICRFGSLARASCLVSAFLSIASQS